MGMDAGTRKSSVFTALTQPVAEFERDQAAAALPAITETATLRRIADQAAAHAEAAASKAPADQQENAKPRRSPAPPRPPTWRAPSAPPADGGRNPRALSRPAGGQGRMAILSPEGDVFDIMAGRYKQNAGPNLGVYLKGHAGDPLNVDRAVADRARRPAADHRSGRQPKCWAASRPAGIPGPGPPSPVPLQPPAEPPGPPPGPMPHPSPQAVADRYTLELQALAASLTSPAKSDDPTVLTLDPPAGEVAVQLRTRPGAPAGRRQRRPGPPGRLGRQARRRHLPPRRPPPPRQPPPRQLGSAHQPKKPSPLPSDWPTTSSNVPGPCST